MRKQKDEDLEHYRKEIERQLKNELKKNVRDVTGGLAKAMGGQQEE